MVDSSDRSCQRPAVEIVTAVQSHLNDSPSLMGSRILCEEDGGRIVLRGYVSTYSMKHAARALAESVSENLRIEDRLEVIPFPPKWKPNSGWNGDECY